MSFTATVANNGIAPVYQWLVNGIEAGSNSPVYSSSSLSDGDVITCVTSSTHGCAPSTSNNISLIVYPTPEIAVAPTVTISSGESITLRPVISGDIARYVWSPGSSLSDNSIANPVARPLKNTAYDLEVTTTDGCKATGTFKVNVFTKLGIPNAFSPNGDKKNDVFYIMGGLARSRIRELSIFNRWGQQVFQVKDVLPGDPALGWNGHQKGAPAPAGTYVYSLIIRLADGTEELHKGSFVLVR